jgi:hypothetical protein
MAATGDLIKGSRSEPVKPDRMDLTQTPEPMAFQFKQHNLNLIWQTKDLMLQFLIKIQDQRVPLKPPKRSSLMD